MSITSWVFAFLCVLTLILYWIVLPASWRKVLLLVASVLFYILVSPSFAVLVGFLLLAVHALTYVLSTGSKKGKGVIVAVVSATLLPLFYYKSLLSKTAFRIAG